MKRPWVTLIALLPCLILAAQPKIKARKYPSLLWEISGNGMKQPSYLIGTMHVSSKLAFHLPDSFYIALRNAQVVALETNPETWQEDMSKYDFGDDSYPSNGLRLPNYFSMPSEYLSINTLKFYKYDKKIERALYSNPSTINNLLYRSYGNKSSDFEEDTYLDMYIFQCGKKWGKRVTGVENYGESMKLMTEAYMDAAKDKNKKERSYDGADDYSTEKLQEAYRSGNLDLLDSINQYNSFSTAFDEKFLYKRNEIQARSMDSIIRSGTSLFVGVGAAHLPGNRGVIELLRRMGYRLRPVKMGERDSRDKDEVDRVRVPVTFHTENADDGLFKVEIPGKFYKVGEDESLFQKQYADMANGSYYMVTRVMTNAWMWGHNSSDVMRNIDSLLYENIPGKILTKNRINRNGYPGFDIINRTRRGDVQRYNIFITPFEIIFFKMSGNGDYVKNGEEANKFFGSIKFKEYNNSVDIWKKYTPPYGGFSIDLPHEPYIGNDGSWIYDADDKSSATQFRIIRSDIHNYHFVEEDTFDLGLMDESFSASEFIDSSLNRKQTVYKGYPALDCKYRDKAGGIYLVRFLLQGPHYYTLVAHGKKETAQMNSFLNSFEITPFTYGEAKLRRDTALYFTVTTPVYPESKKIKLGYGQNYQRDDDGDGEESENNLLEEGAFRSKTISNDTTGEKIYVSFFRLPRYAYVADSLELEKNSRIFFSDDTSWIIRSKKKTELPGKMEVLETVYSDTGSSRVIWTKTFYKKGIGFYLISESDSISEPSEFVRNFYNTFSPADSLQGIDPFVKKSNVFFDDFLSSDTVAHKRAIRYINQIELDSTDLPRLKLAIRKTGWNEKRYLDIKGSLIRKLGDMPSAASSDYAKELYYALDDTVQLQYTALESLLQQQTAYAFNAFKEIISTEPPVLIRTGDDYSSYSYVAPGAMRIRGRAFQFDNGNFLDELNDSLELSRSILQDILPLMNLEDYKPSVLRLLSQLVDSNLVKAKDYESYFSRLLIEAKQELKKQSIAEKNKAIEKEEQSREDKKYSYLYGTDDERDSGNDDLGLYATLLLPFWDSHPVVQPLLQQMLRSNDKELRYRTMMLFIRNKRAIPDSLLDYFAKQDDYRFELYLGLKALSMDNKFPKKYNNHLDLGISALRFKKFTDKPDSLVYLKRLPAEFKGKKGFIYFYKYKVKKDDIAWKIATVGLTPQDPDKFEYDPPSTGFDLMYIGYYRVSDFDFTTYTETKIEEDESLDVQLATALKRLLYSHHKSAKDFYDEEYNRGDSEFDIEALRR